MTFFLILRGRDQIKQKQLWPSSSMVPSNCNFCIQLLQYGEIYFILRLIGNPETSIYLMGLYFYRKRKNAFKLSVKLWWSYIIHYLYMFHNIVSRSQAVVEKLPHTRENATTTILYV